MNTLLRYRGNQLSVEKGSSEYNIIGFIYTGSEEIC